MANGGRIEYTLGFKVDTSSLNQIDRALSKIKNMTSSDLMGINPRIDSRDAVVEINKIKASAEKLGEALNKSINPITRTTNFDKLNSELRKSGLTLGSVYSQMSKAGSVGVNSFRDMTTSVLKTNIDLTKTNTLLDKIGNTLKHSLKWQLSAAAIQGTMSAIKDAYNYVVKLDTSLNNIQIVTQKSADEMERFARQANTAAKAMGASTTAYTDAALIYYQEGLGTRDAQTLADLTVKIANVTGESAETVSQNVTAVVNGYQLAYQGAEQTMDKLAAVAANSASNLNELSTAMSKTAASANMVGMDVDKLTAAISTTISVTRQAPESVGTAYKTILARLGDLKLGETGEDGETLGSVSSDLQKLGINILDTTGELRNMGDIITEIGEKWQTWDTSTKQAAAISMAGKRQYTMLSALFDNWDRYNNMLAVEGNSLGTLQQQQDTYMESTHAHLQKMKTSWEDVYDSFLDSDTINIFADAVGKTGDVFARFIDGIGGGISLLTSLGFVGMQVFSDQIASGILNVVGKFQTANMQTLQFENSLDFVQKSIVELKKAGADAETLNIFQNWETSLKAVAFMTEEEKKQVQQLLTEYEQIVNEISVLRDLKSNLNAFENTFSTIAVEVGLYEDFELALNGSYEAYQTLIAAAKEAGAVFDIS